MTLENLIIDFEKLGDNIAAAAKDDDEQRLRQLDSEIQALFLAILEYRPETPEQRVAHCNFLLENLVPLDRREGVTSNICDKIVGLVANA